MSTIEMPCCLRSPEERVWIRSTSQTPFASPPSPHLRGCPVDGRTEETSEHSHPADAGTFLRHSPPTPGTLLLMALGRPTWRRPRLATKTRLMIAANAAVGLGRKPPGRKRPAQAVKDLQ